jgi:intracellular sulfur oxidation DsrE/DsrF family protein
VAVVVHGAAVGDMVTHTAYRERAAEDNPNAALIDALSKAGVRIIVCGQTAASRGVTKAMLLEPVEMALSAMTAFAVLQERGYRVNPF